jgi:hypothetical protein
MKTIVIAIFLLSASVKMVTVKLNRRITEMCWISAIKILFLQCDKSSLDEKLKIPKGANETYESCIENQTLYVNIVP